MLAKSAPHITYKPDSMLGDLLATSQGRDTIIIVEDKDPSILWQMSTDNIKFWRNTLEKAKDRWQVIETPTTNIVTMYHKLLNKVVPRNLMPGSNSFGTKNMPYAYFPKKGGRRHTTGPCHHPRRTPPSCTHGTHMLQGGALMLTQYSFIREPTRA